MQPCTTVFDKKFKTVISQPIDKDNHWTLVLWLNDNSSGSVDICVTGNMVYIGFEDKDDELLYRIKYRHN